MVSAENCGKIFSMPVTNVPLANGTSMRGVQVEVGSSGQLLAMVPTFASNNTLVYDNQGQCDKGLTQAQCSTFRGGLFDSNNSTTYEAVASMSAAGVDASDTFVNATSDIWSTDMFHFTSNISSKVAFGIRRVNTDIDKYYLDQHILGVGANSTLLSMLKEAGAIASRSWSMYWGNSGAPETQRDGVFVFGGYDSTKVTGKNYTFPLTYDSSCETGMVVSITDLELTFPNGTTADLFQAASTSLKACLVPDYPVLLTIPRDPYWENLQLAADVLDVPEQHTTGLNFWGETFSSEYYLDFGMSISLQSGPSISITNSQVVQPDATILSNGMINYNSTLNEVNIIPLQQMNENDIVKLGRQFLSGAYLMVNEDAGTFTLWETPAIDTSDGNLVAVDAQGQVFSPTCASATSNNTTPGSTESASVSASASASASKTSIGTIVGPVVGGIAGLGLLVGLGVFLWKRSRKNKAIGATGSGAYVHDTDEKAIPLYDYSTAETTNSMYELRGKPVRAPVNELSGEISPTEKKKTPTATSGVHELGDSY
ncbi:hypothetical protein KCU73_g4439, partial [Aureobasidium melanogenum]